MTPATLIATAARYERSYGCRKGDGGTADQLRAGAEAMVECERLRAALFLADDAFEFLDLYPEWADMPLMRARPLANAKLAALQGDPK